MINFNFQYIKNLASPGVWRRGYSYYQDKQVESVQLCDEGIMGKVKGNFRDEYTTILTFHEDHVKANCDCPFPDEWCKHAVAVALIGISDGLWDKFWGVDNKVEQEEPKEYKGSYRFLFNDKSKPKHFSIKLIDRKKNETVSDIEAILRSVVEAQKQKALELNEEEKKEFFLMNYIYKIGKIDPKRKLYYIPLSNMNEIMPILASVEDLRHSQGQTILKVETNPLKLIMNINISLVGNVLVALHWKRINPDDILPYEEVKLFAKRIQWGLYNNKLFPIETKVGDLPYFLSKSSFLDIRGAEGGKFLFEQLPKFMETLEGELEIEESELVKKARLETTPPKKVLSIEMPDESTLRVALEFDYGGVRVPYSDTAGSSPYVCVVKNAPPQKQYSIEEFREQEAAKMKADIEAGLIDPAEIERKKKKVIRVKVLKDKLASKASKPSEKSKVEAGKAKKKEKEKKKVILPPKSTARKQVKELPKEKVAVEKVAHVFTSESKPLVVFNDIDFDDYIDVDTSTVQEFFLEEAEVYDKNFVVDEQPVSDYTDDSYDDAPVIVKNTEDYADDEYDFPEDSEEYEPFEVARSKDVIEEVIQVQPSEKPAKKPYSKYKKSSQKPQRHQKYQKQQPAKQPQKKVVKSPSPENTSLSSIDGLLNRIAPKNTGVLSQNMVKKKTQGPQRHEVIQELDLVDKIFNSKNPSAKKQNKKSDSSDKGKPPKRINKDQDSIEETIITNEDDYFEEEDLEEVEVEIEEDVALTESSTVVEEPEEIYWMKRHVNLEKETYKELLKCSLTPVQTNKLEALDDNVIDFVGKFLPALKESDEWIIECPDDIDRIRIADAPAQFKVEVDFGDSHDSFVLSVSCTVGSRDINLDQVQEILKEGKKYIYAKGTGFAEIPLAEVLQLTKTLNSFDANKIDDSKFRVHTYKVGLIAELLDNGVNVVMSEAFQNFWNVISSFSNFEDSEVPESIQAELREYQVKGYSWLYFLYKYGLNGILADDMGLGKTLQALTLMQKARDEDEQKPSLVVCPTSVVFNWEDEIKKFTPELSYLNYTGPTRQSLINRINSKDVVITSYALLRRDINLLKRYEFRYVILDEAQKIKNYQSLTANVTKQLQCKHRLALSGTPIENRLSELWSVFDFLMPGFLYDYQEFKYRYSNPIEENNNKDAERRLKKQVFPFILRRLKQNVAKDLPDKLEFVSYCELKKEQKDIYLDILDNTREEIFRKIERDGFEKSQMSILAALLRLRQVCCHPTLIGDVTDATIRNSGKFEHLKEMLKDVIENGHRVLLFSQFVQMLEIVKKWLEDEGIPFEYLTGATKNRKECVDRFNNDPRIPIFLISLKAGGTGLNLTGADYVIHYDPWWNPAVEDQATDRAHRIGQTKKVFVYRLITKGTVEEKMINLQKKKRDLIDSVITVDTSLGKLLTYEDLKDILTADF